MSMAQKETRKVYSIDGDKIGNVIDAYIIRNELEALSQFSASLVTAVDEIRKTIMQNGGAVVFCGGDNVMFLGDFDDLWCEKILNLFQTLTGCTASMGVGDSATEVYLALKLAKANGGGKIIHYPS